MDKIYRMEFEDGNFEYSLANNDSEVLEEAGGYEEEHGTVYNIFEEDEDGNEIRTVL